MSIVQIYSATFTAENKFYSYSFRLKTDVFSKKKWKKIKQDIWEKTAAFLGQLHTLGNKAIIFTHRLFKSLKGTVETMALPL